MQNGRITRPSGLVHRTTCSASGTPEQSDQGRSTCYTQDLWSSLPSHHCPWTSAPSPAPESTHPGNRTVEHHGYRGGLGFARSEKYLRWLAPLDDEEDEAPSDMVVAASSQMCLEERGSDTISNVYGMRNPNQGHGVTLYSRTCWCKIWHKPMYN